MKYLILASALFLCACTPKVEQNTFLDKTVLPEELKDCTYYKFSTKDGGDYKGYSCPDSTTTTTYKSGKSTLYLAFIN